MRREENHKQKILAIVGPTASGKSKLSLEIAKRINAEIISADSMQVYNEMNIATDKVSPEVRREVKHHLVDVASIKETFNAARYQKLAREAIEKIMADGKTPIIVGGSGLYIRAAIYNLNFAKEKTDARIRQKIEKELEDKGIESLQEKLKEKDRDAYNSIDINNSRRLVRSLELIETTGNPFKELRRDWNNWESVYSSVVVGLTMPRDVLYERINLRVDEMMASGLLDETKKLLEEGLEDAITAKQALGYKELTDYLEDKVSLEKAVETLKKRTRNYAKRQLTWFKKDPSVIWFDITKTSLSKIAQNAVRRVRCEA